MVHDHEDADPSLAELGDGAPRGARRSRNDGTPGLAGARNCGCGTPRGPIVASCDDDDLWHPEKIRRQVERLHSRPAAARGRHRDPPPDGRSRRRLAGPAGGGHPRATPAQPGQGAAQLHAGHPADRVRQGRRVRRGAAPRVRRGLRLAAARLARRAGRRGHRDARRHPQGRAVLVPRHAPSTPPTRSSTCWPSTRTSPATRGPRPGPGPDRLRPRHRRRPARRAPVLRAGAADVPARPARLAGPG